jgi:hypothetical protein
VDSGEGRVVRSLEGSILEVGERWERIDTPVPNGGIYGLDGGFVGVDTGIGHGVIYQAINCGCSTVEG